MYLFDNDYENALDKCGKPMLEKFAYDEGGLIVLEVVYILLLYSSNILSLQVLFGCIQLFLCPHIISWFSSFIFPFLSLIGFL